MKQRLWQKPVNIYIYILATILLWLLGTVSFNAFTSYASQINIYNGSFIYPTTRNLVPNNSSNSHETLITIPDEWKQYNIDWGVPTSDQSCDYNSRRTIYIPDDVYKDIKVGDYIEFNYNIEHHPYMEGSKRLLTFKISGGLKAYSQIEFPYGGGVGSVKVYITEKADSEPVTETISYKTFRKGDVRRMETTVTGHKVGIKIDITASTHDAWGGYGSAVWITNAIASSPGYTITFNVNGGSTSISSQTVSEIILPSPGTKTGYTFDGWYNGNTRIGGTGDKWTPTADATITAKWKPRTDTKYTVKHQLMNVSGSGYTLKETETLKGTTDASVTPATKSYTGFTAPAKQTVTIAADGSRVVNYYYSRNKYTFTMGGNTSKYSHGISTSGSSASGSYYYGATITLVASPKAGYTWQKWSDGNTNQSRTFTMPANALTITPYGSLITYTIRYNTYEGNLQKEKTVKYTVESSDIVLENPILDGKEFLGWSDWNDPIPKKPYTIPKGTTGDLIISANWRTDKTGYVDNVFTGESYIKSNRFTIKI